MESATESIRGLQRLTLPERELQEKLMSSAPSVFLCRGPKMAMRMAMMRWFSMVFHRFSKGFGRSHDVSIDVDGFKELLEVQRHGHRPCKEVPNGPHVARGQKIVLGEF